MADAPSFSRTTAAVFASVPYSVFPSPSKVRVTITGSWQTSFAAIKAARVSCRLIMVSTAIRSTPASQVMRICSRYTETSSSKSIFPMGASCSPVMVRSAATYALPPAASLESATSSLFILTTSS